MQAAAVRSASSIRMQASACADATVVRCRAACRCAHASTAEVIVCKLQGRRPLRAGHRSQSTQSTRIVQQFRPAGYG
jgi:hypothetical protein